MMQNKHGDSEGKLLTSQAPFYFYNFHSFFEFLSNGLNDISFVPYYLLIRGFALHAIGFYFTIDIQFAGIYYKILIAITRYHTVKKLVPCFLNSLCINHAAND